MTNYDRWRFMTEDVGAPEAYLTFAFYAGVSIALERRVFYGDLNRPLFCNNYTLFIGRSGIGKGQAMREIKRIVGNIPAVDATGKPLMDRKTFRPIPMFQSLADTLTFEQIIAEMAKTRKQVNRPNNEGIYESSPFYVCLEELSSLVRINKDESVARLLLNLYDASEPFRYDTKKSGCYEIRAGCLNLLAGTTLDFLNRAEKAGLVGEGLLSRMLPVYADTRPEDSFEQNVLSPEQLQMQAELQKYFFRLGHIFGPLTYTPAVKSAMDDWWKSEQKHLQSYADEKLSNYFSRRRVQVMKLAAAIELSESVTFEISLASFMKAAEMIRGLEPATIQLARRTGSNAHYNATERFLTELRRRGEMTHVEVISWLEPDLELSVIMSTLAILKENGRIQQTIRNTWTIPSQPSPTVTSMPQLTLPPSAASTPNQAFMTVPLSAEALQSTLAQLMSSNGASSSLRQEYLPSPEPERPT